jgi:hypothetical protein
VSGAEPSPRLAVPCFPDQLSFLVWSAARVDDSNKMFELMKNRFELFKVRRSSPPPPLVGAIHANAAWPTP